MTTISADKAGIDYPGIGFLEDGGIISFDSVGSLTGIIAELESRAAHVRSEIVDGAGRRWRVAGVRRSHTEPERSWWQFWRPAVSPVRLDIDLEEMAPLSFEACRDRGAAHVATLFDGDDRVLARIGAAATMEELSDACMSVMLRTANRRILQGAVDVKTATSIDVARRAMVLFAAVRVSHKVGSLNVLGWLDQHDLISAMSPDEVDLFGTLRPSDEQRARAGWNIEALAALVWALGKRDMPEFGQFVDDIAPVMEIVPPTAAISVRDFMTAAELRPMQEIAAMAESYWQRLPEAQAAGEDAHEAAFRRCVALQWIVTPQMGWE
ncbi:hypothetical protein ASE00_11440 [Sphingomonas sp. Root710]|uniref:DUF4272 domain-containing protein n=1 Tax=Sphingomonas sp. Root710 TaxID=1736594 RepID=UPI0006FC02BF|nr:DUF4272 domain-containing protein [Sphingomonas sp. Root710]KRB82645.1 hypothetical protein ASE00_11440 [Sphingomonas sp. Root710]